MGEIIASTYELQQKLGAGGGGVVYLGRHLRLEKQVVLKADKRKITTSPELLRREVDVLKNLSHPYIPQVYDFFVENETVYSVIEYIEGESLDKPLAAGVRFPQSQVIHWARQLLEAVVYLHSPIHGNPPRGYVHADIKPANIMCRPNGDICLIDFNIALAIGEENVVGASGGYASPEHYGLDYSSHGLGIEHPSGEPGDATAKLPVTDEKQSVLGQKKIIPDERSDIYSLGATLYHLFSGRRPPKSALEVEPLTTAEASRQICEIVAKAMQPNPELRYQTASEMLDAFEHLWENDPRSRRLRRSRAVTAGVLAVCFLLGGALALGGSRQMEREQEKARIQAEQSEEQERLARLAAEENEQKEREAKEAEQAAKEQEQRAKEALALIADGKSAMERGDNPAAVSLALEALEKETAYDASAQHLLTDALGTYELSDGFRPSGTVEFSASALDAVLSPDGKRAAVIYPWSLALIDTGNGEIIAEYNVERSAMSRVLFPNETLAVFAGEGGIQAMDARTGELKWSGKPATGLTRSADGTRVAAVYRTESEAYIYEAETGALLQTVSFGGRKQRVAVNDIYIDERDNLLTLNADGSLLAVSFSDGSLSVFDTANGTEKILLDPNDYTHFEGGFYQSWVAFCASGGSQKPFFAAVDLNDRSKDLTALLTMPYMVQADERGIYLAGGNTLVRLDPVTAEQTEIAYTTERDIAAFRCAEDYSIVATEKSFAFFDRSANMISRTETDFSCDFLALSGETAIVAGRNTPTLRLLMLEQHPETQFLRYDRSFDHREARVSADGKTIMLFRRGAYQIYSAEGTLLTEGIFPDDEQIYDHQFRRDGEDSWLEVFYYDGLIRSYSAKDGSLLAEEHGTPYDKSLEEDFYTDRFHIHTTPHEAPQVYDLETGALVGELEKEDDVTYITQAGEFFIAEYINTLGERYGLLMNNDLEVLARLPSLCDYVDGWLYFDYPAGELRRCPLYDQEMLLRMARENA